MGSNPVRFTIETLSAWIVTGKNLVKINCFRKTFTPKLANATLKITYNLQFIKNVVLCPLLKMKYHI